MVAQAVILVPLTIYAGKKIIDWLFKAICPSCRTRNTVKIEVNLHYCKNCHCAFNN